MAGVASAAIIEGQLIIGLDDGTIIRAGYVQGPQGLKGDPGPMGATGSRGTDGNTILTVAGTPRNDTGKDGDYAIDNANWRIYGPKSGGVWGKAKEMLPGPENVLENGRTQAYSGATGGGGASGGGGGGTEVILSEDPPLYGSDGKPLGPGALWFDTDQKALYVAQTDSNGSIVWVITVPADRSILLDRVPTGRSAASLPPSNTALDGATWFNDTTGLWYIYNGKKKQWIDLPPGQNDLSMQCLLLQADPAIDETFEFDQADRDLYDTESILYGNGPDHENFSRIVVPKKDNVDYDWSVLLRGITVGDQLTLVQVDENDPNDPDDDDTYRSDFTVLSDPTENSESFSFEVEWAQDSPDHLPFFAQDVAFRFKAIVNIEGGSSNVFYQDDAPEEIADNLTQGNLWVESDTLLMYVWTGDEWVEVGSACGGSGGGGGGSDLVTTRDVKTIPREDNPFEAVQALSGALLDEDPATFDPIDDLLKTQEDVNDFIARVSERTLRAVDRNIDNVDVIQNTTSQGSYFRREKPSIPQAPLEGEAYLLQDGGAEAILFSEVQNVLINKAGIGPFADFSFMRVGDNFGIQNVTNQDFGVYVVTSINDFGTWWDVAVVPAKNIVVGSAAAFDEQIKIRATRPVFTIAQDTEPYFSESGQLWYDTANNALKVWDQTDGEFYLVGGEDAPEVDLTPIQNQIDTLDGTVDILGNRVDNIEQLQRDLHDIVSEGFYTYPSFNLSDSWPGIAQYLLATTVFNPSKDSQVIANDEEATFFEDATYIRISAISGPHAHLERAEVGDYLTIQTIGTDAGGKYEIEHIRIDGTSGPTITYEMGIKFVEGLADGNIIIPHDAQIQVLKPFDFASKEYVDAGDAAVLDEILEELDKVRQETDLVDYSFNYILKQSESGVANTGECVIVDPDPELNQMFILHSTQLNGEAFDITKIQSGDEIVFEQDLGHYTIYDVVKVEDRGNNQIFLSVDFLRYEGDAEGRASQIFFIDRLALIYKRGERPGYVKIDGDEMTGPLKTPKVETLIVSSYDNTNLQLQHTGNTKIYVGAGGVTIQGPLQLNTEGTNSNHAVTKGYVDANSGGFSPGEQVAKTGSSGVEVGGFFIENGNLYCKIS